MKKIGFEEYLKHEISSIRAKIEQKELEIKELPKKIAKLFENENKEELKRSYNLAQHKRILITFKAPSDKTLLEYYKKQTELRLKTEIKELNLLLNDLLILRNSFKGTSFNKPLILSTNIIIILIEFGKNYNIEPYDLLNEILLLSKLNSVIDQKNMNPIAQFLKGLGKLFKNDLTLRNENDIKAVEFILRKVNYELATESDLDKRTREYVNRVTLSINDALTKTTEEERKEFERVISTQTTPRKKELLHAESDLSEYMISSKSLGNTYSKEVLDMLDENQLLLIEEAFKIIKKSKNKDQAKLLKRAINDVISSCRYLSLNHEETTEPQDINKEIEALSLIIRTIKVNENQTPLYNYAINQKSGYPILLEDIRAIEESYYETVLITLQNLDTNETTKEVFRKGKHRLYEAEYNGITVLFTKQDDKIIIISAYTQIATPKDYNDYIKIIKEQFSNEPNNKNQVIYSILIENELSLSLTQKMMHH